MRIIRDVGRGVFYGASEQDVYEQMEHFLDETPRSEAVSRTLSPKSASPMIWEGVLVWQRLIKLPPVRVPRTS